MEGVDFVGGVWGILFPRRQHPSKAPAGKRAEGKRPHLSRSDRCCGFLKADGSMPCEWRSPRRLRVVGPDPQTRQCVWMPIVWATFCRGPGADVPGCRFHGPSRPNAATTLAASAPASPASERSTSKTFVSPSGPSSAERFLRRSPCQCHRRRGRLRSRTSARSPGQCLPQRPVTKAAIPS